MEQVPTFTKEHYEKLTKSLDPIIEYRGYLVKKGDDFKLGLMQGSKVRQCLNVVYANLERIKKFHNNTIITGCGLPSPQGAIVATVGKYFGLNAICVYPKYPDKMRDYHRINVSLAQKVGGKVYGVGNPNPTGYAKDVRLLVESTNAFEIKFGMIGDLAMQPIIYQVQNVPECVKEITIVSGSGLSALSVLRGLVKYKKNNVKQVNIITLSSFYEKNKRKHYDILREEEKYKGIVNVVPSAYHYQRNLKYDGTLDFDITYESKAFDWLVKNREPSKKQLFWVVGIKNYDLENIEKINWHTSSYEQQLNNMRKERALRRETIKKANES